MNQFSIKMKGRIETHPLFMATLTVPPTKMFALTLMNVNQDIQMSKSVGSIRFFVDREH